MAFKIAIGKSAERDLFAIYDWYAGESEVALSNFSKNFFHRLDEILKNPEAFGLVRQRPNDQFTNNNSTNN